MAMTVIGGLALAKIRRLVQIFPSGWMVLWDDWEIRVVILYSLLIQIVLMVMGSRRKYMSQTWARAVVWAAYLSADWAATFALGLLSNSGGDYTNASVGPDNVMTAFWAPFLLLHLGGPDTITAYSLEDNELWRRHFLSVFASFMIALYITLKFWGGTLLDYASIPVFIAGLIKCVERTLALKFASQSYFTESMIHSAQTSEEDLHGNEGDGSTKAELKRDAKDSDHSILIHAYGLFMIFERFFADYGTSKRELKSSQDYLRMNSSDKAFEFIGIELGLSYDLRYTKAKLTYSHIGFLLRFLSLFSSIVTFVVFVIVDKHVYSQVELTITWLLLIGAISLEFYAVAILVSSDWFMIWLTDPSSKGISRKLKDQLKKPIGMIVPFLQLLHIIPAEKRWSGTMGQCSLISFCFTFNMPEKCTGILKFFGIYALLEKERSVNSVKVPKELNEWIFNRLQQQMVDRAETADLFRDLRLGDIAKEYNCLEYFINHDSRDSLEIEVEESTYLLRDLFQNIEFDHSIVVWHIATDFCYNDDLTKHSISFEILRVSKLLSDYMMYLLVTNPSMLPKGMGQLIFRHAYDHIKNMTKKGQTLAEFLSVLMDSEPLDMISFGDLVLKAKTLANCLRSLGAETGWDAERKWMLISNIWIEMLCYAAAQCRSTEHAQQLRRGGELLTHVWFLMAHMGFIRHISLGLMRKRARVSAMESAMARKRARESAMESAMARHRAMAHHRAMARMANFSHNRRAICDDKVTHEGGTILEGGTTATGGGNGDA